MASMPLTLDHLRRYAVARSLFKPTTLMRAIAKLGFVQADPIRAPARAQDLTLRHRVSRLSRRRTGAALSAAAAGGRLLRQLRFPAARAPRADASAQRAPGVDAGALEAGAGGARIRRRTRRRASARSRCALRPWQDHQLVRRVVQRQHSAARRHALPRPAAGGATRRRHPRLCDARRCGAGGQGRHRCAPGCADRCDRQQVRAAARSQPGPAGRLPGARRAAVERRAQTGPAACTATPATGAGAGRGLAMARRTSKRRADAGSRTNRCAC